MAEKDLLWGINAPADPKNLTDLEKKHIPVIDAPSSVEKGKAFKVTVSVGKLLPHPNEPGHHIEWIDLYADKNFLTRVDLIAVVTVPEVTFTLKLDRDVTLRAFENCNLHGVWESDMAIKAT